MSRKGLQPSPEFWQGEGDDAAFYRTNRLAALRLAVMHHGAANLNPGSSTPASKQTVLDTADTFLTWLEDGSKR